MTDIPISPDIINDYCQVQYGITIDLELLQSVKLLQLVDNIEKKTGIKFVRMEMGVPGLPAPSIGIEAEIAALQSGVASVYPDIEGIESLKNETSRFIKLFLDIDINPEGCIPTVGSMMGAMVSFLVANRNDRTKEGTLFIDPGFPVQKQQVKMLGHDYYSFDIYNYRGKKLKDKLESYLKPERYPHCFIQIRIILHGYALMRKNLQ